MSSLCKTSGYSFSGKYGGMKMSKCKLVISLTICLFALSVHAEYEGGTGTAADPYQISSTEQMNEIGNNPDDWNKHFILTADIDMNDIAAAEYNIIEAFSGTFDGNNHTISNFKLTTTREMYTGLFGSVSGFIRNLGLIDPNIFAEGGIVGSLAGHLDQGIITNCYAKRAIVSGGNIIGGLVGSNDSDILECYSTGIVSGNSSVGGLVGRISEGTVKRCYSKAGVSGNRSVGGLVGITVHERSEITNSYANGSVEGDTYIGGLAGQVEQGNAYKCYSTGSVSGNRSVGGFVGNIRFLGNVLRCFWDIQTSGQLTDPGGTGKTTEEMQTISTFTSLSWDFWNIWTICEGTNYPVLLWQIPVADFLCPDGVNFIDFAFFASHWERNNCNTTNSYCNGTDLNQSGSVDFMDLEIFAEQWLEGLE